MPCILPKTWIISIFSTMVRLQLRVLTNRLRILQCSKRWSFKHWIKSQMLVIIKSSFRMSLRMQNDILRSMNHLRDYLIDQKWVHKQVNRLGPTRYCQNRCNSMKKRLWTKGKDHYLSKKRKRENIKIYFHLKMMSKWSWKRTRES